MKTQLLILIFLIGYRYSGAQNITPFALDDSVKVVQFMTDIKITGIEKKRGSAGIKTNNAGIYLENYKNFRRVSFGGPGYPGIVATGINVSWDRLKFGDMGWTYDWKFNETYKLLISMAGDSAGNYSLYSGYVFLPNENKWKFIGTHKISGFWNGLKDLKTYCQSRKVKLTANFEQVWIQRSNGTWKNLKGNSGPNPVINLFGHLDSVQQRQIDIKSIEAAIDSGKTDVRQNEKGVYYKILKEGTGRQVMPTDTVSVYYHLHLLNDTATIDEAKNAPARFPLNRLIRGWSIGVPLIKVGGKIRLVIPSDLAYSIRTRSPKIPPNSILVFTIEVVDAKSPD